MLNFIKSVLGNEPFCLMFFNFAKCFFAKSSHQQKLMEIQTISFWFLLGLGLMSVFLGLWVWIVRMDSNPDPNPKTKKKQAPNPKTKKKQAPNPNLKKTSSKPPKKTFLVLGLVPVFGGFGFVVCFFLVFGFVS